MSLSLNILNSDCTLNAFQVAHSVAITSGETANIILQLWQVEKKIRYIPAVGATFSMTLLNSDGTTIVKTPTLKFPSDDRSILLLALSAAETANLISQNLILTITEGLNVSVAVLQSGLQKISLTNC